MLKGLRCLNALQWAEQLRRHVSPPCFAAMFTLVTITADQDGTTRTDRINLSLQSMKYLFWDLKGFENNLILGQLFPIDPVVFGSQWLNWMEESDMVSHFFTPLFRLRRSKIVLWWAKPTALMLSLNIQHKPFSSQKWLSWNCSL